MIIKRIKSLRTNQIFLQIIISQIITPTYLRFSTEIRQVAPMPSTRDQDNNAALDTHQGHPRSRIERFLNP